MFNNIIYFLVVLLIFNVGPSELTAGALIAFVLGRVFRRLDRVWGALSFGLQAVDGKRGRDGPRWGRPA